MTNDVVCKMQVNEQQAAGRGLVSQHDGQTYYFCSGQCKREFDNNPQRYAQQLPTVGDEGQAGQSHPYAG